MFIKRLTKGLTACAIAGILILTCEKMNGPEPPYMCTHDYNQLLLSDQAGAPIGAEIPLNSFNRLVINDGGLWVVPQGPDGVPGEAIEMPGVKKIIFKP